jgi:hypothetical protein
MNMMFIVAIYTSVASLFYLGSIFLCQPKKIYLPLSLLLFTLMIGRSLILVNYGMVVSGKFDNLLFIGFFIHAIISVAVMKSVRVG